MPNSVDDELEEIKRLIADPTPGSSVSKELVPSRPGQAASASQKKLHPPANNSAHPVPVRKPAPPVPVNKPAPLAPVNKPAPPAPINKPAPLTPIAPPAPAKKSPPPPLVPERATVREFDISSDGEILTPKDKGVFVAKEVEAAPEKKTAKNRKSNKEQIEEPIDLDTGDDDFKVNFDFDGEYKDVPEDKPLRLRRERKTGCIGGILYAAFIISVSLVLGSLLWMAAADVLGFGSVDEQVNVVIPNNFEMADVTDILYEAGLIRHRLVFNMYASFSNAEERIVPGTFVLNKNFDYRALVQGMTPRAGQRIEVSVTIPEGFTLLQIFNLLDNYGVASADELWYAATNHDFDFHFLDSETIGDSIRLEGFLFPNTYMFFLNSSATSVLNRLLREFDRRFTEEMVERAEEMGFTVREIVIIASMIERETGSHEESPRIAAAIYNRLANPGTFPLLQIDATIQYAVQGTGLPATTDLDHPFNTYIHPGLPPGPIANPGMHSINAALHPLDTNEFFWALNLEGTHNFFATYAEHRAFVQSDQFGAWWR